MGVCASSQSTNTLNHLRGTAFELALDGNHLRSFASLFNPRRFKAATEMPLKEGTAFYIITDGEINVLLDRKFLCTKVCSPVLLSSLVCASRISTNFLDSDNVFIESAAEAR